MAKEKTVCQCLNCSVAETKAPLVTLRFNGGKVYICTQCLPTLIHNPGQLASKLSGAENLTPVPTK